MTLLVYYRHTGVDFYVNGINLWTEQGCQFHKIVDYMMELRNHLLQFYPAIFHSLLTIDTIKLLHVFGLWRVLGLRRPIRKYNECYKAVVLDWWWCSSSLCSAGIVLCLGGANDSMDERRWYIKLRLAFSGPMYGEVPRVQLLNCTQNRTEDLN